MTEKELDKTPFFYQSLTNNASKDILEGSRKINQDFIRLVGYKDKKVTLPAGMAYGDYVRTEVEHGVTSGIPFVFMYLKVGDYFLECGIRGNTVVGGAAANWISNAYVDSKSFYFDSFNNDFANPIDIEVRGYIYELLIANPS